MLMPCFLSAQIDLNAPTAYRLCDINSDGVETFDLTAKDAEVLGGLDPALYSIAYFQSQTNAIANINALDAPAYTNTSFPQVIWARVWENADPSNYGTTSLTLLLQALPDATLTVSPDICVNENGYYMFTGTGGTPPYTFYYTINSGPEQIVTTTGPGTVATAAIQNNEPATFTIALTGVSESAMGCSRPLSATATIAVHQSVSFVDPDDMIVADSPFDGVATFDLTTAATVAVNGVAGYTASLFLSAADAASNVAQLTPAAAAAFQNTSNPQTIWVAITNDATGCKAITDFHLIVTPPTSDIVYIPDTAFKLKLLEANPTNTIAYGASGYVKVDTNDDGEIQFGEAGAITKLNVSYSTIVDLTGVEKFTNLNYLESINNLNLAIADVAPLVSLDSLRLINGKLTAVHLPAQPNLKYLDVQGNKITTLDIGNSPNLNYLACFFNKITSLDLSPFADLKHLSCSNNDLTSLDLSASANLEWLDCAGNALYTLNLQNLSNLTTLYCDNTQISTLDLTPVPNLLALRCNNNHLTALDLSPVPNLTELLCNYNKLTSLDVSQMTSLQLLDCHQNEIAALDVTGCSSLKKLECQSNAISTLNLQNMSSLKILDCGFNAMTSLNVTGCTGLLKLVCSANALQQIDLGTLGSLQVFSGHTNLFTELDFSNNPMSASYTFDGANYFEGSMFQNNPNLVSVNFKNGSTPLWGSFGVGNAGNLPNLLHICIDDTPEEFEYYNFFANNGISLNSYCSFTPGGDFNTISGHLVFDADSNGCDASDLAQPFLKVLLNDDSNSSAAFVSNTGDYAFYTGAGNFTVTPDLENPSFFNYSPASAVVNFPAADGSVSNQPFCISANGQHSDAEVILAPVTPARPGFDAVYKLVYRNKGNQLLDGTVSLNFDSSVLQLVNATPAQDSQASGQLTFDYSDLLPFENREIIITLHVNSPVDAPAVNVGEVLAFSSVISQNGTDESPADNTFNFNQVVVGSFDPNNMTCIEGDLQPVGQIGQYLHYIASFENTGTDSAVNIVVKTLFDEDQFDVSSLRVVNTSAPADIRVQGNKVEYVFNDINLAIGGHGNILLKIKTRDNLSNGDMVANGADIFFDYNLPIATNDAETTFQMLSVGEHNQDRSISVYPNPASGVVNVTASGNIQTLELYDIQGRLLQTALRNEPSVSIDISGKQTGVYFLKVTSDKGSAVQKIVKK